MENLKSFGVKELNSTELKSQNGGFINFFLACLMLGAKLDELHYRATMDNGGVER